MSEDTKEDAVEKAEKALQKGFAEVETPSEASEALDKVEAAAGHMEEKDVPDEVGSSNPAEQAEAIKIPIKRYFRRRRPFISIVRAIVVGREPGSYSFPSGHSAAAFAGATLLQACYPRGRWLFFAIALLVAFSRVYLGAHYPGDVLSGGVAGGALAKLYRTLINGMSRT